MNHDTLHPKRVVVIWYIDALYFYKKPKEWPTFNHNVVVGNVIQSTKECVVLEYTEENGKAKRGLLLPTSSIVFSKGSKNKHNNLLDRVTEGMNVAVTWQDIVYFDDGNPPKEPSKLCTKGRVLLVREDALIVHNIETLLLKDNAEFPDTFTKPTYFMIPAQCIVNIEENETVT